MICSICPRHCNIDREKKKGFCSCGESFRVARSALHFWEEPCISGKNGSGTVFFSGCNLKCVYCQNYEISIENKGIDISDEKLIELFESLIEQGANNINLVNPTHYSHRLAGILSKWESPVPIVYNTSGYEEIDSLKELEGLVDIYLTDLKYIRSDKALKYSGAENYFDKASKAILEMRRQVNDSFCNDIMKSGLIVRHLILPQNTNSALKIIDWMRDYLEDTYLSLMAQYTPFGDLSDCREIDRKITKREYDKVVDYALEKGHNRLFIQSLDSADEKFIPAFDFTGVL